MASEEKTIAVVLYPGMTALDLVGSLQALKWLHVRSPYRVVAVAERIQPVPTDTPLKLAPNRALWEVAKPFGLLLPGGGDAALEAVENPALREYIAAAAYSAELVASIGTGSLILAELGLLAGRQATTHWAYAAQLRERGADYVRRRWVEDGKFVTAAGVTAGIDLALQLVAKLTSVSTARQAQLIIEYDPQPPFGGIDWERVDRENAAAVVAAGGVEAVLGRLDGPIEKERI
ncbi:MAG TPA: DJ-1/PfpI family protein [Thermomicrobiaceae bacterium]|nr:DJ-1/PfpI family protein [Thermomicrobiaceae bacterium]